MGLELRLVQTPEEWRAMHDIRREVLFAPERRVVSYDEEHPDDRAEGNHPHLLVLDDKPVGVVRLDLRGEVATVRLVAITREQQRLGYGRTLEQLLAEKARDLGVRHLRLNSAPDAVGFYEKTGWRREEWDASELVGMASNCVQMVKDL